MKKIITLLLIAVCMLLGTPYDDLSPHIYELQMMEANDWTMEINLFDEEYFSIDTFMIKNINDSAFVLNYALYDSVLWENGKILVVTPEDLSKPLSIDKENDIITLIYFMDGRRESTVLKLGEYPGSYLHNIDSSQSICWDTFFYEHYKSNTPTFGKENRSDAAIIYGKIYDIGNVVITNSSASFYHYPGPLMAYNYESLDEDGNYQAEYHARSHKFEGFGIWLDNIFYQYLEVNPVEIDLEPGDSIEVNFYASTVSIKPVIKNAMVSFHNYPQPASNYSWLSIDNTEVEASAMRVNVYALNGRKVDSFVPSARQFRYDCTHLPQGSYILTLQHGQEVLATKKLQILK